jgi:hypothetical protein
MLVKISKLGGFAAAYLNCGLKHPAAICWPTLMRRVGG